MSWQASSWVLKQKTGNPILKVLLLAVANYADPDGRCWPSVETLADDSEVSKRTIQRKLQELQALGFIKVTERFEPSGRQMVSLIELRMGEGDNEASEGGRVTPACHGEGDTTLSPTRLLNNHKNKQSTSGLKKKDDGTYSPEFEAVWQLYPRTRNTSKKDAWNIYRMLNDENQGRVRIGVIAYAAAMKAEGRPEDKIKHMTSWLNGRMYETASGAATPAAAKAAAADWYKTATLEQWTKVLAVWRGDMNWRQAWGPEPGRPGCMVPESLLTEGEKFQISLRREPKNKALTAA